MNEEDRQAQKRQNEELLRLMTGYDQHASHTQLNAYSIVPNQPSYTFTVDIYNSPLYIRNINFITEVIDGLPA